MTTVVSLAVKMVALAKMMVEMMDVSTVYWKAALTAALMAEKMAEKMVGLLAEYWAA